MLAKALKVLLHHLRRTRQGLREELDRRNLTIPHESQAAPVFIAGEVKYVLGAVVFSERFSAFFAEAGISPQWPSAIVDQEGRFVARNIDPAQTVLLARPELGVAARGPEARM